jgi:hemerythrin-like domain-containing protein
VKAIRIIQDEHRSLAAVLHGLQYLVRSIRFHLAEPDFALFHAILNYIEVVPERFHHPKEDRYLFRLLRERVPASAALLDRLQEDHRVGADKVRRLSQALARYEQEGEEAFATFATLVGDYAAFEWNHMQREEADVLPLAKQFLTRSDWEAIDAAFTDHTDPLFGATAVDECNELFRRIVQLAPPPLGTDASIT